MPRNLDDFELDRKLHEPKNGPGEEPVGDEGPEPTRYLIDDATEAAPAVAEQPSDPGRRLFPLALAGLAIASFSVLAIVYLVFRPSARPAAATAVSTLPAPPPLSHVPPAEPAAAPVLPPLEESDAFVRQDAARLSSHPEVARWLAQASLVPTLAAVVTNVADGESPRPHLGFLAPAQRFRAKGGRNGRIVPDPAGFAGYDRFADALATVDAVTAVAEYRRLEPLFEAAWRELGHPEGGFTRALERALSALLAVPVPDADVALRPHATGFRYADARLEELTPAQKQFLRMGPRNVQKVQAKLREVRSALALAKPPANAGP